jgi:hypothetical protein
MAEPTFLADIQRIDYYDDRFYAVTLTNRRVVYIPSITTKLNIAPKPYLIPYYKANTPEEINRRFTEGQLRGSRLHWAFYVMARRGAVIFQPPPWRQPSQQLLDQTARVVEQCKAQGRLYCFIEDQDEWLAVLRVREWFRVVRPQVIASELMVWSLKYEIAGTLDLLFEHHGGTFQVNGANSIQLTEGYWLLDYKTGAVDEINHFAQLAAYLKCLEEDKPEWYERVQGCILCAPRTDTMSGIPGLSTIVKSKEAVLAEDWPYFLSVDTMWRRHNKRFEPKIFDFETVAVVDEDLLKDVATGQLQNETEARSALAVMNTTPSEEAKKTEKPKATTKSEKQPAKQKANETSKVEKLLEEVEMLCKKYYPSPQNIGDLNGTKTLLIRAFRVQKFEPEPTTIKGLREMVAAMKSDDAVRVLTRALQQIKADCAVIEDAKKAVEPTAGEE